MPQCWFIIGNGTKKGLNNIQCLLDKGFAIKVVINILNSNRITFVEVIPTKCSDAEA